MKTEVINRGAVTRLVLTLTGAILLTGCRTTDWTPEARTRAVWLWNTADVIESGSNRKFASFCAENDVGLALINFPGNSDSIGPLVSACRQKGIRVHALAGSPEMVLPRNHSRVISLVDDILYYNSISSSDQRIGGLHLDIEPYLLDEYKSGMKGKVLKEYVHLMRKVQSHIQKKRNGEFIFGADIPFWFDKDNGKTHRKIIDCTDYVCIMAYRNSLEGRDGIISLSIDEIEYAGTAGKHVFVGVETDRGEGIPEKTTFAEKGSWELMRSVKGVEDAMSNEPAFSGVAIHHYKSWSKMR